MPRPDAQPVLVPRDRERLQQVFEVRQRFAHAHHNDVGEASGVSALTPRPPLPGERGERVWFSLPSPRGEGAGG